MKSHMYKNYGGAGNKICYRRGKNHTTAGGAGLVGARVAGTGKNPAYAVAAQIQAALDPRQAPSKPRFKAALKLCDGTKKYLGVACPGCLDCRGAE